MPDQNATPPTEAELAALARSHRAATTAAIHSSRATAVDDTAAAHTRAADDNLAAGRPAAAIRHLARAAELAPGEDFSTRNREASRALEAASRPRARAAGIFVGVVIDVIASRVKTQRDAGVAPAEGEDFGQAVEVVNVAAARLGANQAIKLQRDAEGWPIGVVEAARSDRAAAAAMSAQPGDGHPCEWCGAPRWTFAHDDDAGEFCAVCGHPQNATVLGETRRRLSMREQEQRIAGLEAQVADRDGRLKLAAAELSREQGKVEKLKRTGGALARLRGAGRGVGPMLAQAPSSADPNITIRADADLDDILAAMEAHRQAVEHSSAMVARLAVRARQLAAERGVVDEPGEGEGG